MPGWRFINALAFLFWGSIVLAAPPAGRPPVPPPIPAPPLNTIVITSQSLVFKNQENMAVFDGKVVMVKVGFNMHADHMIVYFAGTPETGTPSPKETARPAVPPGPATSPGLPTLGNRAVSLIESMGHVIIVQGGKTAKSKKAVYSQPDEKLVLTGDPEVWEEGYHVTGVKMTMFLKEDRSIVENSRVVIHEAGATSQ
jgi:lipopolysaccharide export system protein LptA